MNYFKAVISVSKVFLILFSSMIITETTVYADCNGSVRLNNGFYEDGIDGPYVNNGNGTISDQGTGLMWQRTSDEDLRTYQEACNRCDSLVLGGHSDWELPDIYQLHTIVDTRYSPAVNNSYFTISGEQQYWSGSTNTSMIVGAFTVNFETGHTIGEMKLDIFSTRCVRIENPMPKGPLSLEINADKLNGEAPLDVSFRAETSGGAYPYYPSPYSFSWDFGYCDKTSDDQYTVVTFYHPGKYTVNCTVSDKSGNTVQKTLRISVTSGTDPSWITYVGPGSESTVTHCQGDDGMNGPYVDNGDGTVLDKGTGLVWMKYGSPGTAKWSDAVSFCHNVEFAEYDDWELPNIYELQTIVHEPGSPTINTTYFKDTEAARCWSGNRYTSDRSWYVDFSNGTSGNASSDDFFSERYYVRCVRLGSFPPPFSDDEEGSIRVTISPQGAIDAGAQWRVDSGQWQNSGATQTGLTVGNHTVDFKDVAGWTKPGSTTVNIQNGQTTTLTKSYTIQGLPNLTYWNAPNGSFKVSPQSGLNWGDNVTVSFGFQNSGTSDIPSGTVLRYRFYLSTNSTISTSDYYFKGYYQDTGLAVGYGRNDDFTEALPSSPPTGFSSATTVYIGMIVDPLNEISESNETDNKNQGEGKDYSYTRLSTKSMPWLFLLLLDD
jgi:PKD repeat protein